MKFLIASALLFASVSTFAAQSLSTKVSGNYSTIRALGMGNAFSAVADDYSLIMYNPAGFARKQYNEVQITLVGAGVSSKTLTITKDIQDASDAGGTDNDKAQRISDVLAQYYGQSLGGKVQALEMFWVRKNWGIALLPFDLTLDMTINRQLGPAIDLNIRGDSALAFGYGDAINKTVDMGITAKYIHRIAVEQSVSALELATNSNVLSEDRFKEGTTFDFDLGFMYTPDWFNVASAAAPVPPAVEVPAVADSIKSEEVKPEEKKPEEKKPEEKKPDEAKPLGEKPADAVKEEDRKPQAEEPAVIAAEPAAPADPVAASADKKPQDAAPLGTVILGEGKDEKKAEVKAEENKSAEEKLKEAAKTDGKVEDAKAAEEVKSLDTAVKTNQEKYPLKFSFVVHNVIGGEFSLAKSVNKNATEVPTKNYRVIDVGTQYLLTDMEDFKIRAMVDFQNILHPEVTLTKSFHTGLEFDYSPSGWFRSQFRAGINQMYYTAGATLLLGVLNLEVATYGEEVGTDAAKIENRVLAAKLGLNF